MSYIRRATHAQKTAEKSDPGWYPTGEKLDSMLKASFYYASKETTPCPELRGILAPHSCYSVCLRIAASAYSCINPDDFDTIYLFGASHYLPTYHVLVSDATSVETPFGSIDVDTEACAELLQQSETDSTTGELLFSKMTQEQDEAEHSNEMQYPLIKYVFGGRPIKIVPMLIGCLSEEAETKISSIIGPKVLSERTLFIISSDFTHWGSIFKFTGFIPRKPLNQTLMEYDKKAMNIISEFNYDHFRFHIEEVSGSICGSYSICLILRILAHKHKARQIARSELSEIRSTKDFSISYLAIAFEFNPESTSEDEAEEDLPQYSSQSSEPTWIN